VWPFARLAQCTRPPHQRHARAQEVADGHAIVPRYADEPRYRRADKAQNLAQRARNPVKSVVQVHPAEHAVEQRHQGQKLINMMPTLKANLPPSMVPRAMAPIRFSSLCSSSLGMTTLPSVAGIAVSGTSILAIKIVPARS